MNTTTTSRILAFGAATALLLTIGANSAEAQEDTRWLPLVGCWVPVGELGADVTEDSGAELLCVSTNADGGVDMRSYQGTELLGTVGIVADGQPRSVEREGCRGTEVARFADDRRYITSETDYVCDGEVEGRTAGLIAMVTPFEWINAQVVEADEGEVAGVMRYTLASAVDIEAAGLPAFSDDRAQAIRRSRIAAARPLDVGDVIAASTNVHPQTLQAWIVEQDDMLPVSASELGRMADAGVSDDVIDMVVAVSHPSRFAIQQGEPQLAEGESYDRYDRPRRRLGFFPGSFGYLGWTRYGYGSGYGYGFSPYSYSSLYGYGYGSGLGRGYGYGYPGYRPIIVIPNNNPNVSSSGRAVKGRGYTRGSGGSDSGRRVTTGSSSSGGSSARTSQGSGSRGSSTGRKAKRRGGGSDF